MASSSFRDSINSLGWSRREQPAANTANPNPILGRLQKLNPFSNEGYVRLPTHEGEAPGAPLPARTRREEEEGWLACKSWDTSYNKMRRLRASSCAHAATHTHSRGNTACVGGLWHARSPSSLVAVCTAAVRRRRACTAHCKPSPCDGNRVPASTCALLGIS